MTLNETTVIQLLLAVETPLEELTQLIEEEGERIGEKIKISSRMEARARLRRRGAHERLYG